MPAPKDAGAKALEGAKKRVRRWQTPQNCAAKNERRMGTKPRSNAQFIRKVDQDK